MIPLCLLHQRLKLSRPLLRAVDLIILDLAETGNYIAARPSGTEPKVKFYMFTYVAPEQLAHLEMTAEELESRLDAFQQDLANFAETV